MTFTATTPSYLIGQLATSVFDMSLAGLPRGSAPNTLLGSTLTAPISLLSQAIDLGFTPTAYTPG
jgi:hypothetical protein